MKRTILFLLAAIAMGVGAKAQELTATLQQNGTTTVYYGSNAFKEAYASAKSGAVITLSSGSFNTVDSITKSITIIGSGHVGNVTSIYYNTLQTPIIIREFEVNQASLIINTDNVKIDGIKFDYPVVLRSMTGLRLSHCYFKELCNTGNKENTIIDQCFINSGRSTTIYIMSGCTMKNSFVDAMRWSGFRYLNCVLYRILAWGKEDYFSINGNLCRNCMIGSFYGSSGEADCKWNSYSLQVSNRDVYSNCVLFLYPFAWNGSEYEKVDYLASHLPCNADNLYNSNTASTWENLFDEDLPWYDPNYIKTTTLGDDGKVVGPYGGTGFSPYPSVPRITESKIDTYTDGEGKLNVKVKVEVGQ